MSESPHRPSSLRTLVAALFVLALTAAGVMIAMAIVDQQKLDRCVAQGRRDCIDLKLPAKAPP